MLIGSRQRLQTFNTPPSLFIDNAPIHQVVSTKSLGVYVDDNFLSWNVHIDNIAKNIASGIGILKRSRPFVTLEVLSTIYSALVQPYFDYCSTIWGNCNQSLATKLQKLQNRTARILTFSPYDASVDNLFTSLAWKKLETQRKIQTSSMVYKSLNGLASQYMNSLFSYRNEVSSYSLRDSEDKLQLFHCPTLIMLKTVSATEVRCCGIVYVLSCSKRKLFPVLNTAAVISFKKCVDNSRLAVSPESYPHLKLGFFASIFEPVRGGLDWLFLLINWTKRMCYKEKTLLYSI